MEEIERQISNLQLKVNQIRLDEVRQSTGDVKIKTVACALICNDP